MNELIIYLFMLQYMNKYVLLCIISIIIIVAYIYINSSNTEENIPNKDKDPIIMDKCEMNSCKKEVESVNIEQIDEQNDEQIDDINDIFISEKPDFAVSETTKHIIDNSFKNIMNTIYRKIMLLIYMFHMNRDFEFKFEIDIQKDSEITNNFLDLLRAYNGSTIYKFDKKYSILYMGDYLNNNGTTNLNANRIQQQLEDPDLPSFIPARSISMVGIRNNNNIYIGSFFILNFNDIDDKQFIFDNVLLPFGKFYIEDEAERIILTYYLNILSADQIRKPKIKSIYEVTEGSLLS